MQMVSGTIRLAGKVDHQVFRSEDAPMSVAEVAVLRHLHGNDAVVEIRPVRNDKRSHQAERRRLEEFYGEAAVTTLFPGLHTKLPVSMKDIEIEEIEEPAEKLDHEKIEGED